MCNASAHGRSVAWRVTCYASVHDVSMPHPTPPPCSRLIRRLKLRTYEKYGDIKIQHTLTGRRLNRLPKTTVRSIWSMISDISSIKILWLLDYLLYTHGRPPPKSWQASASVMMSLAVSRSSWYADNGWFIKHTEEGEWCILAKWWISTT